MNQSSNDQVLTDKPRVVFFGTPSFAVPTLEVLAQSPLVDLRGVVTQPDRPAGRGRRLKPPPVKSAADALVIPVWQISTLKDPRVRTWLVEQRCDLFIVAAFGLIFGRRTLVLPTIGAINVHASLLPKYRGASPVASAIYSGEHVTGVTLMQMDEGLDTGPMLASRSLDISQSATTNTITEELASLGAELFRESLPGILRQSIHPCPQEGPASLTRPLVKEDGSIDWRRRPQQIVDHIRAMVPWPRASSDLHSGVRLTILEARAEADWNDDAGSVGRIVVERGKPFVTCGSGRMEILSAQLPGARPVSGEQLLQRRALTDGETLAPLGATGSLPPLVVDV